MKNSKNTPASVQIVEMNGLKLRISTEKKWVKADALGTPLKNQKGEYLEPTPLLIAQHIWADFVASFVDTPEFKKFGKDEKEKAVKWIKATQDRGTTFNLVEVDNVKTEIVTE